MPISRLNAAGERRLHDVINQLADSVDSGDNPTDALYKIASKVDLHPQQVELVARMFNTGRTLDQYASSKSPVEKAAAIPLCNAADVLERLYPAKEKLAANVSTPVNEPNPYQFSPKVALAEVRGRPKSTDGFEQTIIKLHEKPRDLVKEAVSLQARAKSAVAAARGKVALARDAVRDAVHTVTQTFREYSGPSLPEVEQNWTLVKGAAAKPLFDSLKQRCPLATTKSANQHIVDFSAGVYAQISDVMQKTAAYHAAIEELNQIEATEKAATISAIEATLPRVFEPGMTLLDIDRSRHAKAANLTSILAGAGVSKGLANQKTPDDLATGVAERIGSPAHEEELSAIRAKSMLDSLMISDPIIGGYPREQVLSGYTRLSELAPRVLRRPIMAQSQLRKYLEQGGAVDTFEASQLLDAEKKLAERDVKVHELQNVMA